MTHMLRALRRASSAALVCGSLVIPSVAARAQATAVRNSANARWAAWIGCWQPTGADHGGQPVHRFEHFTQIAPSFAGPVVCIAPAGDASSVDVLTLDSSKVLSRYAVDASGASRPVNRDGCEGREWAQWSRDSLRVFLHSDVTCANGLARASNGVMSIAGDGDWVDVHSVSVGGRALVSSARYRKTATPSGLPPELAPVLANANRMENQAATIAAGAPLTGAAIAEATKAIDTATVQAWLVERNDPIKVDVRMLTSLADAGVPGSVTDVMVALAHPDDFHFDHSSPFDDGFASGSMTRADSARIASEYTWRHGSRAIRPPAIRRTAGAWIRAIRTAIRRGARGMVTDTVMGMAMAGTTIAAMDTAMDCRLLLPGTDRRRAERQSRTWPCRKWSRLYARRIECVGIREQLRVIAIARRCWRKQRIGRQWIVEQRRLVEWSDGAPHQAVTVRHWLAAASVVASRVVV